MGYPWLGQLILAPEMCNRVSFSLAASPANVCCTTLRRDYVTRRGHLKQVVRAHIHMSRAQQFFLNEVWKDGNHNDDV